MVCSPAGDLRRRPPRPHRSLIRHRREKLCAGHHKKALSGSEKIVLVVSVTVYRNYDVVEGKYDKKIVVIVDKLLLCGSSSTALLA